MNNPLRVMLGFATATDGKLEEFAGVVVKGLTDNPAFPNPPVKPDALNALLTTFRQSLTAQEEGGKIATASKQAAREALIVALRELAAYVQQNCNNEETLVYSAGFNTPNLSRTQRALEQPTYVRLTNGNSGQLLLQIKPVANARAYELQCAVVTPDGTIGAMQKVGLGTNSRALAINDLKPGTTYAVQVRAVGGSTRYSDWSDPTSRMCM